MLLAKVCIFADENGFGDYEGVDQRRTVGEIRYIKPGSAAFYRWRVQRFRSEVG